PFTSAGAMARQLYALLPRFIVRLSLDNLGRMRQIRCPVLVFHGDADRLVPTAMGREVAAAAAGPVELVLIHGAGHNETYDRGGRALLAEDVQRLEDLGTEEAAQQLVAADALKQALQHFRVPGIEARRLHRRGDERVMRSRSHEIALEQRPGSFGMALGEREE